MPISEAEERNNKRAGEEEPAPTASFSGFGDVGNFLHFGHNLFACKAESRNLFGVSRKILYFYCTLATTFFRQDPR